MSELNFYKSLNYYSIHDFAFDLYRKLSHEEIVYLIKVLDETCECWDVTLSLIEHFEELRKQYEEEGEE